MFSFPKMPKFSKLIENAFKTFDKGFEEFDEAMDQLDVESKHVKNGETHETVVEETRPDGTKVVTRTIISKTSS